MNENVFLAAARDYTESQTMTLEGTVLKTAMLLCVLVAAAGFTWVKAQAALPALTAEAADQAARLTVPTDVIPYVLIGTVGGFVVSLITIFKPAVSPFTAPLYAALEGLALGGISAGFEYRFPGIVVNAVTLTFGTLAALLTAYSTRLVRPTENFKLGLLAATGGVCLVYVASFVLGFFGISIPLIHESGMVGIGFSLFVVVIAALNLVLDFDFIETGVRKGAPKYMEWYGGFGLLVTLVWLYLEILRLLSKLRSRD
jgi:uncharacterized YccA/Bax inhibitor family protein